MELIAKPSCYIGKMDIYPDIEAKKVNVRLALHASGNPVKGELTLRIREKDGREVCRAVVPVSLSGKEGKIEQELALGKDMKLWDEFSPALYGLTATLATEAGEDIRSSVFGMRRVEQGPEPCPGERIATSTCAVSWTVASFRSPAIRLRM